MYIVIFVTCVSSAQAKKIASALVSKKLAACVNIVPAVRSLFWWQGKVDKAAEVLLIIKSRRSAFPRIARLVRSLHSYTVPEVIAMPIVAGNKEYLEWIDESVR
jgi:periplasmic divalent cation tolerance protein